MRIVSLVDNISERSDIGSEHGLSFYIETTNHKILFDLGASALFSKNAEILGIDLELVDTVIISHGHYDHGGGLKHFMTINQKAKIYIKKEAFLDYYSIKEDGFEYIGLDKSLSNNPRIIFADNDFKIDSELQLFSGVKTLEERYSLNQQLKEKRKGEYLEDNFLHEQNLVIEENNTNVLIAGCAHNGIVNIIHSFITKTGSAPDYVFGGFHLASSDGVKHESEEVINLLAKTLNTWDTKYFTCHCTGVKPYRMLKQILNEKINYFSAGKEINT